MIVKPIQTTGYALNNALNSHKNVKSYIIDKSEHWQIKKDSERFRKSADTKTGFSNIDSKVSFFSGIYILGAVSILGKTTVCF